MLQKQRRRKKDWCSYQITLYRDHSHYVIRMVDFLSLFPCTQWLILHLSYGYKYITIDPVPIGQLHWKTFLCLFGLWGHLIQCHQPWGRLGENVFPSVQVEIDSKWEWLPAVYNIWSRRWIGIQMITLMCTERLLRRVCSDKRRNSTAVRLNDAQNGFWRTSPIINDIILCK